MGKKKSLSNKLWLLSAALPLVGYLYYISAMDIYRAWCVGGVFIGKENVRFQTRENDCGPASLQMIFDHYSICSTIDAVGRSAGLTEKGVTMFALKQTAKLNGLDADGWRLTAEELSHSQFPALLFVNHDHFVVADSVCGDEFFLRDPAIGRVRISRAMFSRIWKGETLLFHSK